MKFIICEFVIYMILFETELVKLEETEKNLLTKEHFVNLFLKNTMLLLML